MFSDAYKIKIVDDVIYEVYGKYIQRTQGGIEIAGFNPSAEDGQEDTDEAVESGVDIVLNHRLRDCSSLYDKKSFKVFLRDYVKK